MTGSFLARLAALAASLVAWALLTVWGKCKVWEGRLACTLF